MLLLYQGLLHGQIHTPIYIFTILFMISPFFMQLSTSGYSFLFRNSMIYKLRERISEILTYTCGFFAALAVFDGLYIYRWESPYILYFLPLSRVVMVLLFSILPPLISESTGFLKFLYIISLFLLPFAVAFVSFFYFVNNILLSGIILAVFVIFTAWLFYYYSPVIRK